MITNRTGAGSVWLFESVGNGMGFSLFSDDGTTFQPKSRQKTVWECFPGFENIVIPLLSRQTDLEVILKQKVALQTIDTSCPLPHTGLSHKISMKHNIFRLLCEKHRKIERL